jgi:hypothetical protein
MAGRDPSIWLCEFNITARTLEHVEAQVGLMVLILILAALAVR